MYSAETLRRRKGHAHQQASAMIARTKTVAATNADRQETHLQTRGQGLIAEDIDDSVYRGCRRRLEARFLLWKYGGSDAMISRLNYQPDQSEIRSA
jgi:hypothetical protein